MDGSMGWIKNLTLDLEREKKEEDMRYVYPPKMTCRWEMCVCFFGGFTYEKCHAIIVYYILPTK